MNNVDTADLYRQYLKDTYDYMYAHRTIGADGGEDEDSEAAKNRKWVHDAWISAKLYLEKLNSDDPPSVDEQAERRQMQEGHLHELALATHGSMIVTQHTVDLIIALLDEEDAYAQYYAEDGSTAGSEYSAASTIPDQDTAVERGGGRRKRRSSRKRRKTKRRRKKRRKKKRYTKKSVKRRRRRRRTTRRK